MVSFGVSRESIDSFCGSLYSAAKVVKEYAVPQAILRGADALSQGAASRVLGPMMLATGGQEVTDELYSYAETGNFSWSKCADGFISFTQGSLILSQAVVSSPYVPVALGALSAYQCTKSVLKGAMEIKAGISQESPTEKKVARVTSGVLSAGLGIVGLKHVGNDFFNPPAHPIPDSSHAQESPCLTRDELSRIGVSPFAADRCYTTEEVYMAHRHGAFEHLGQGEGSAAIIDAHPSSDPYKLLQHQAEGVRSIFSAWHTVAGRADNMNQACEIALKGAKENGSLDLLVIRNHGNERRIQFTNKQSNDWRPGQPLPKACKEALAPDATVVINSCFGGEHVNHFSKELPGREIVGPTTVIAPDELVVSRRSDGSADVKFVKVETQEDVTKRSK